MNSVAKILCSTAALSFIAACTNGTAPNACTATTIEEVADAIASSAYYTDVDLSQRCEVINFPELAECGLEFSEYRDLVYSTMNDADEARILSNSERAYWGASTNMIVHVDLKQSNCGSISRHIPSQPVFQGFPSIIFDDK